MQNQCEIYRFQVTVHALEVFDKEFRGLSLKTSLEHSKMLESGRIPVLKANEKTFVRGGSDFMARLDSRRSFVDTPIYIYLFQDTGALVGAAGFQVAPLIVDSFIKKDQIVTHTAKLRLSDRYDAVVGSIEVTFGVRHFISDLNVMQDAIIEDKANFMSNIDSQLETEPQIDDSHFRRHAETNPLSNYRSKTRLTMPDLLKITRRYQLQTEELVKEIDLASNIVGYAESIEKRKKMEKLQKLQRRISKLESKMDMMSESSSHQAEDMAHFDLLDTLNRVQDLLRSYKPRHHRTFKSHKAAASLKQKEATEQPGLVKKAPPAFVPKLQLHSVQQTDQSTTRTERIPRCFRVEEKRPAEEPPQSKPHKRVKTVSARLFSERQEDKAKKEVKASNAKPSNAKKPRKTGDKVMKTIVLSEPAEPKEDTINLTAASTLKLNQVEDTDVITISLNDTIDVKTPSEHAAEGSTTQEHTLASDNESASPNITLDEVKSPSTSNIQSEATDIVSISLADTADIKTQTLAETTEAQTLEEVASKSSFVEVSTPEDTLKQSVLLDDFVDDTDTTTSTQDKGSVLSLNNVESEDNRSSLSIGDDTYEEPTLENLDPVIQAEERSLHSADFAESPHVTSSESELRSSGESKSSSSINFQLSRSDPKISDFLGTKEDTDDPSAILSLLNTDKIDSTKNGSVHSSNLDINSILSFM